MGKRKYVRCATPGAAITIDDANPRLAARLKAYEQMSSGGGRGRGNGISFSPTAFHRPGSHKK